MSEKQFTEKKMKQRTRLEFSSSVPHDKRPLLAQRYESFSREKFIRLMGSGIQTALQVWVENGNDPYVSNRYGFYDSVNLKYLDFLDGEYKLIQLIEIASGQRPPADCALNQFGEPSPRSSNQKGKAHYRVLNCCFERRYASLLNEARKNLSNAK